MPILICQYCGKMFKGHGNRKMCSRECADKAQQDRRGFGGKMPPSTLCWKCKNTNAFDCPWFSKKEEPVPGWKATPTILHLQRGKKKNELLPVRSYIVHECPLFVPDRRD